MFIFKKLLRPILWFSRSTTPSSGPSLEIPIQTLPRYSWWKPVSKIDTGYGFEIDKWTPSVRCIDWILQKTPLWDEFPTIHPQETGDKIASQYQHRIPKEVTFPHSLEDFLWKMSGSYFLETDSEGNYFVDLSEYEQLEVRPGYERYGGKVWFKNGRIQKFEYQNQTYPPDSLFLDQIVRASLCLKMMVEMHALRIHLGTAQIKTLEYRQNYFPNSPWMDFLYLTTYGTLEVNQRIPILVGPQGLVPRLFALTPESYQNLLNSVLSKPPLSREEFLGTPGTAWQTEISQYFELVQELVSEISNNFTEVSLSSEESSTSEEGSISTGLTSLEEEQQIRDFVDFFVTVTALHNQFGDVQIFSMAVSNFFLPKVYSDQPGYISPLDQELLITLLVAVSPRYPLITDSEVKNVFSDKSSQKAWKKFTQSVLNVHSEPHWFQPVYFETSVGF